MQRIVLPTVLLFYCFSGIAIAADEKEPVTDNNASSVPQEPDVTIIQRGHERVEEFSMNNRVYMIKITPAKGYPYYLVDTDGDGNFDTRRPQLTSKFVIPQWVLLHWK
jgi:Protein of unknown function (DUF2782)